MEEKEDQGGEKKKKKKVAPEKIQVIGKEIKQIVNITRWTCYKANGNLILFSSLITWKELCQINEAIKNDKQYIYLLIK